MGDERLWTVDEMAEFFDVHESTVQGWIRKGHFEGAYKKGPGRTSPWVVPQSAIEEFAQKLKTPQNDA